MILHIKGLVVSDKKISLSFPILPIDVNHLTLRLGQFWPQGHNLNKFGRGS